MQKSEDVVTHMNKSEINYLVGNEYLEIKPLPVYSDVVCDFLDDLSKELRKDREAKGFPDVLTFAFWCRKANVLKLKEEYPFVCNHIGRGVVFHIAPSNVPINFAYTLTFGMLAGNANIVRVSEKDFEQTKIVCRILKKLLAEPEYRILEKQIQIVSYGHNQEVNDYYSSRCDVRVIWGGDATIKEIRKSPLSPRATEITFADRYSFAVFDEKAMYELPEEEVKKVAEKFYNDTYLMDQNACSSPHLIFWINMVPEGAGRKKFWEALYQVAEKYDLPEKKVMDKYTLLCENAACFDADASLQRYGNLLYVVSMQKIPEKLENMRGKFGFFYEASLEELSEICDKITDKIQTCVIHGVDREELLQCFINHSVRGVDRIVPVGKAMDIGVYWDGYDVIGSLSRGILVD